MLIKIIKCPLRYVYNISNRFKYDYKVKQLFYSKDINKNKFEYNNYKNNLLAFIDSLKTNYEFEYKYSATCNEPTLYASAYVCMSYSLIGELENLSKEEKSRWVKYFNTFQDAKTGLFYDPVLDSEFYRDTDWWGARHLATHMISAYTDLGGKPSHPFYFLKEYYDTDKMKLWLDSVNWSKASIGKSDIDNKIMNIGCLLQYQRDTWNDNQAGAAVTYLQNYLLKRVNSKTGMWGEFNVNNSYQRSRMVQFAYHLYPLFFYDDIEIPYKEKIIPHVLKTQNELGGFGIQLNSSACEDIDSIDILIRLASFFPDQKPKLETALRKALNWVLLNQVDDGGLVFRLYEPFTYGNIETSSIANQGAMLPTWFRTLSIAYLTRYFSIPNHFLITRCPGCEF